MDNYVLPLINAYKYINSLPIFNACVVFDIDDTLIESETHKPIQPTVDFYHYIKSIGFHTVIVTAREGSEQNIEYTIDELKNLGINDYTHIFFRLPHIMNLYLFKKNCRKYIYENICPIIISIGDKTWDFGEYGGMGVLVGKDVRLG